MTLGSAPGAAQGTIAPEGGCPGNFFTSRKWAFEHDALIIRDHKGQPLAQLSFTGGHFEGQDDKGGTLSLSRKQKKSWPNISCTASPNPATPTAPR